MNASNGADPVRAHRGKILVVDDDSSLAEMLTIVLRNEGFEPRVCASGDRAMSAVREFKPDVVLLDLMLPGKDGVDVCREIRAESGVPIIMLTAKSDTVDIVVGPFCDIATAHMVTRCEVPMWGQAYVADLLSPQMDGPQRRSSADRLNRSAAEGHVPC